MSCKWNSLQLHLTSKYPPPALPEFLFLQAPSSPSRRQRELHLVNSSFPVRRRNSRGWSIHSGTLPALHNLFSCHITAFTRDSLRLNHKFNVSWCDLQKPKTGTLRVHGKSYTTILKIIFFILDSSHLKLASCEKSGKREIKNLKDEN